MKFEEIKELVKLINDSNINEMVYEKDGTTLSLKKGAEVQHVLPTVVQQPVVQAAPQPVAVAQAPVQAAAPSPAQPEVQATEAANTYVVKAPMVGTFYRSPGPEEAPFVEVGAKVQPNTTVCLLEAMKLFNEIEAEVSGEIIEIHVQAGQLVEFGQPLFTVKL